MNYTIGQSETRHSKKAVEIAIDVLIRKVYLTGNPPQALYEWGKIWLFGFSRRKREIIANYSSHFLYASENATDLWNNNVAFSTGWSELTSVPNWASGYLHTFKIENKWFGTFVCGEQADGGTHGPKSNLMCIIGDFLTVGVDAATIQRSIPNANVLENGEFLVWQ